MKRIRLCIISFIILMISGSFLFGCNDSNDTAKALDITFLYKGDFWSVYDLEKTDIPTKEAYEALVKQYILEIEELLNLHNWWTDANPQADTFVLTLQIKNGNSSIENYLKKALANEVETTINLSHNMLQKKGHDGGLAHELTHAMAGGTFSMSLEDGLCDYVQTQIGSIAYSMSMGFDSDEVAVLFREEYLTTEISEEEYQEVLDTIGKAGGYPFPNEGWQSQFWYLYSSSFINNLIQNYGLDKVMELMENGTGEDAYETYMGKSLEELKGDWLEKLSDTVPNITLTDIEQRLLEEFLNP